MKMKTVTQKYRDNVFGWMKGTCYWKPCVLYMIYGSKLWEKIPKGEGMGTMYQSHT